MPEANNPQPVGKVIVLTGTATAQSSGQERVLEVGSPVYKNDVLTTDSGSKLQVRFIDNTQVSQDESSSLRIDSFVYNADAEDNSDLLLNMMKGTFRTISGEITKDSPTHFMLKTPQGTIGIRGTIIVSHVTDLFEKHGVEELTPGKIVVVSDDYGNIRIFKVPMQMVEFYQGKPVSEVRQLLLDELDEFQLKAPLDLEKTGEGDTPLGYTAPDNFLSGVDITDIDMIPSDFGLMGNLVFQFNSGVGLLGIFDSLSDIPGYDDHIRSTKEDPLSDDNPIVDPDPDPDPDSVDYTVTASEASQDETDTESSITYTFTITRSGDASGEETVDWRVAGTGSNPADADDFGGELPFGTITFEDGETQQEITVTVWGDDITEADETFVIQLIDPGTGEVIDSDSTQAVIVNDDSAPEELKIDGLAAGDNSGRSVSNVGDVNGDGFDDFIIGAPGANGSAGETYVVYGGPEFAGTIDLTTLNGTNGFRLDGIDSGDQSGYSVSNAGDVNGDGYSDLIVGAPGALDGEGGSAGQSYVVFGGAELPGRVDLSTLDGTNGFRIDGIASGNRSGISVSRAGDVNGDGLDDLIVGAQGVDGFTGESYVVFGAGEFPDSVNLADFDGLTLTGIDFDDSSGYAVAGAGDINNDGFDDLIIGAPGANGSAGETYVIYGHVELFGSIDLSDISGFQVDGLAAGDRSGYAVSGAGDVNGDGFDDLIVGAPGANGSAGEAYVVFDAGRIGGVEYSELDGSNGFRISGLNEGDQLGTSVSRAGDVNGDGYDDIIIGAPGVDGSTGESYVVFGGPELPADVNLSALDGTNGFIIPGLDSGDYSGISVSAAGDLNGDGFDDLIVGAHNADIGENADAGESYIIFGQDFSGAVTNQGTMGGDDFIGTPSGDVMIGGLGNDTLDGGRGSDVLYGGAGDDTLIVYDFFRVNGGGGNDTLQIDGGRTDLTDIANNKIQGIERIDLIAGGAANDLTLEISDVLDMSDTTNTLFIDGGADDSVTLSDIRWWTRDEETFSEDGETYQTYYSYEATLHVDTDINGLPSPEVLA